MVSTLFFLDFSKWMKRFWNDGVVCCILRMIPFRMWKFIYDWLYCECGIHSTIRCFGCVVIERGWDFTVSCQKSPAKLKIFLRQSADQHSLAYSIRSKFQNDFSITNSLRPFPNYCKCILKHKYVNLRIFQRGKVHHATFNSKYVDQRT